MEIIGEREARHQGDRKCYDRLGGIEKIKPNAENKFCRRRYQKVAPSKISSSTSTSPKKDGSNLSKKSGNKT
jgi:hypothetical protein